MSDDGWRARIRWVVAHPTEPTVLLERRDGALRLPGTERPGRVWTAEPGQVLPGLRDLLGTDALLLRCLDEHEEPSAQLQRATLLAVPTALAGLPDGLAWAGRAELAGAAGDGDGALAARVVEELAGSGTGQLGRPWTARGWFAGAERWLHEAMAAIGRPLTGPAEQMQVWDLSCVLRAPTAAGHVWFKATAASPLFVNEGLVMGALAGLFGDRVPAPGGRRRRAGLDGAGRSRPGGRLGGAPGSGRGGGRGLRPVAGRGRRPGRPAAGRRLPRPPPGLAGRPGVGMAAGHRGHREAGRHRRRHLAVAGRAGRGPGRPARGAGLL